MALTPAILKATEGLINGQGIGVNSTMMSLFDAYLSDYYIPGNVVATLEPYTSNIAGLAESMSSLQPYLKGNSNIASIKTRANAILPNSTSLTNTVKSTDINKFISIFNQSRGFISTSAEFKKSLTELGNKSFSDLGIGVTKFSDVASGGLSTSFGTPNNLKLVANAISKWGTAYDISNIGKLHNYGAFIVNLQKQGLGSIGGLDEKLLAASIDTADLENANQGQLKSILKTISGADLQKVILQTNATLASTPADLSQFLDPSVILDTATFNAIPARIEYSIPSDARLPSQEISRYPALPAGSLQTLGSILLGIGGTFKTFSDLGNFLNSIQFTSSPELDNISSPADPAGMDSAIGLGHGPNGACIMSDVIGSLSGYMYNTEFTIINSVLSATGSIESATAVTSEASNIIITVSDPVSNTSANISLALGAFDNAINEYNSALNSLYSKEVEIANLAMSNVYTQFTLETTNLSKSGITLTDPPPTGNISIINFAKGLHSYGVDLQQTGTDEFLSNITKPDGYGESINSALAEGKNLNIQSKVGIKPIVG